MRPAPVQAPLGRVRQERRHLGAAHRHDAERQADRRAAQPRRGGLAELGARQPRPAGATDAQVLVLAAHPGGYVEHLAEREDRHRDGHERNAVEQLRGAHREALGAGHRIDPDDGDAQSQHQGGQAAQHRVGDHRGGGHEREEREREVLRGPEARGELRQDGGEEHDAHRGHHAADEGAERRRRQGLGRPAVLGHAVALERGGDGRGLRPPRPAPAGRAGARGAGVHGAAVRSRRRRCRRSRRRRGRRRRTRRSHRRPSCRCS